MTETQSSRIVSVDALRGFVMFWLIGGQSFLMALAAWCHWPAFHAYVEREFEHPPWHGFYWWDCVMPTFIFVSGVTIPLVITRRLEKGDSSFTIYMRLLRRLIILMTLNLIAYGALDTLDWHMFRYTGVLARIGISYVLASILVMYMTPRRQLAWVIGILAGYWAAMALIPVPGIGRGLYTPLENLAGYLDRFLMPGRIMGGMFDRLGMFSTIPTVCTVLIGSLAGHWLFLTDRSPSRKVGVLVAAGVLCRLVGYLVSLSIPINTKFWSPSYVLSAGGWSLLFLAMFYLVIDVWGFRRWTILFTVIGLNSITIYFGQNPIEFREIAKYFFNGVIQLAGPAAQPLLLACAVLLIKWLLLYFLYRKKIFIKA